MGGTAEMKTPSPQINPEILVWARESAGLTRSAAAKKLGFQSSGRSSAEEKLAALENGEQNPSRAQLHKMAAQYRRPLISFYLSKPPIQAERGADFRTQRANAPPIHESLLDALIRDIRARQGMVRAVLEEEEEAEPLPLVGSHTMADGHVRVAESLRNHVRFDAVEYRAQPDVAAAFDLLRRWFEQAGVFVLLKGDLGNYHTAIDTSVFRGFSIADEVAPFIVINDQDARPAWCFTLLHEAVHILLGQTGISGALGASGVEQFCDDIASTLLLPESSLRRLVLNGGDTLQTLLDNIGEFAKEMHVSPSMVAYRAFRARMLERGTYASLTNLFREQWQAQRQRDRDAARDREGGPPYYTVLRHRLGGRMVSLVGRMVTAGTLSTSRAARIMGVSPRQVQPLLAAAPAH